MLPRGDADSLSRIGVVKDPQLDEALHAAAPKLAGRTEAAQLKELALIGAQALGARSPSAQRARRALDELNATPATTDLVTVSRTRLPPGRTDETSSESLEWVRGSR